MVSLIEIRKNPFVRLIIPFITGIWFISLVQNSTVQLMVVFIPLFGCLVLLSLKRSKNLSPPWISGAVIYLLFIAAGMGTYLTHVFNKSLPEGRIHYTGIVHSMPESKLNTMTFDCVLTNCIHGKTEYQIREKVRLYLQGDSDPYSLTIGDSIAFSCYLHPIRNAGNPGEFDYRNSMRNQGIRYSGFIEGKDFTAGNRSDRYTLRRTAAAIRDFIIRKIETYNINGDNLAILTALVAGSREYLGKELKDNYAAAGVMHILAVSGLHVGILYLFLSIILFRNNNRPFFRVFRLIVILIAIWAYALITGLSSSVLRASVMFTLFLVGKSLNRPVSSYNLLAASALLILLLDPLQLFRVGFQFSYLAVFGILYFQPRLENIVFIKNPVLDRIWQLSTISFAAQITTFPLALYYFHRFSVYFWLSNIIVIPTVWLIMVTAMLFFIFSGIVQIASLLSVCLKGLLYILNYTVGLISGLPFSVIDDIRFQEWHLAGFLLIVLAVVQIGSYSKVKQRIFFIAGIVILMLGTDSIKYWIDENNSEFIIYNLKKCVAISLIDGHNHLVVAESDNGNWTVHKRYLKDYWTNREINKQVGEIFLDSIQSENSEITNGSISIMKRAEGTYLSLNDLSLLLIGNSSDHIVNNTEIRSDIDIILVTAKSGLFGISCNYRNIPDKIILIGYLNFSAQNAWERFAARNGSELYSVMNSGALHIIL